MSHPVPILKPEPAARAPFPRRFTLGLACAVGVALSATPASADSAPSLGGYGEIAYNHYPRGADRDQADLKRFVIFLGYGFNDQWSFNSEVEWEHAVASADDLGESEIEQAYLNYQFAPSLNLKTGLFLMPFGLLNQAHEPPVFYGVERNEVETRIIPSTWREGGIGLSGNTALGLDFDAGVTTGFDVAKFDDPGSPLSSMHQELQLAKANDLAAYGALNYRGLPGFTLGGALFTGNSGQSNADFESDQSGPDFSGINGRIFLWDGHTRWQKKGWDLEAVYAQGVIGEADRIDAQLQAFNAANNDDRPYVPDQFYGWLVQGAYTVFRHGDLSLAPFLRYEQYDTQLKMPAGFTYDPTNADRVTTAGFSFKPLSQVVFKADYQYYKDHTDNSRFNLGLGYMF